MGDVELQESSEGSEALGIFFCKSRKEVSDLYVGEYCILLKVDIRDFYVVGEHHVLAEAVAGLFPDSRLRNLMWDAVYFLLDNQYVNVGYGESMESYKVKYGAGIGLVHAGDIADAVYYSMVEKKLIEEGALNDVLYTCRFRDDMLFVVNKRDVFRELFDRMQSLSECFKLKIEEVSTVELRYLDMTIRREEDRLVTLPFLKNPRLSRRLSASSAHAHEVHAAWPRMMLRRIGALSHSLEAKNEYEIELTKRLENDGCLLVPQRVCRVLRSKPDIFVLWLPVGYHPWWYRKLKRAIARLNRDKGLSCLWNFSNHFVGQPVVRLAWKNMLPSTDKLLQS